MSDGQDCKCYARCSAECGCGADWTPQEVYDLRAKVKKLKKALLDLRQQVRRETVEAAVELVLDDSSAMSYQTMGQYRTALASAIRKLNGEGGKA